MAEECKEMNIFVSHLGTFKLELMPFDLLNAPFTLKSIIYYVLKDNTLTRVYFDDSIIFSNSMEEHIEHLTVALKEVGEAGLKLKTRNISLLFRA